MGNIGAVFYDDLVYILNRIVGKRKSSDRFKKIIKRCKTVGYNMDIIQSASLVVNPIKVYNYAVGQASDSMTALA